MRQLVKTLVPVKAVVRDVEALCAVALVGLEEEVEQVLWEEARQHDTTYYDVLHAYLTSRRLYRNVAAAAFEKAQRLMMTNNKNSVDALVEQAAAYAAAANALQLVESRVDNGAKTGGQYILCDFRELPLTISKRKRTGEIQYAP